jgi:hypothetical protein
MKKVLVSITIAFLIAFSFVAKASAIFFPPSEHYVIAQYLADFQYSDGGWQVDDDIYVSASKSSQKYIITIQQAISKDKEGFPAFKRIDSVEVPINDPDYIARGRFACYRRSVGFPDKPIVALLHQSRPVKAWIVKDQKFKSISAKNVVCQTEDDHDHGD